MGRVCYDRLALIQIQKVQKSYHGQVVLGPIDLTLPAKKTHVLLGTSGCGKTTLIRMMLGLIQPDQGSIDLNGLAVNASSQRAIAQETGYVIQKGGLFPHMTALQNVLLAGLSHGQEKAALMDRVAQLSDLMHLPAKLLKRKPHQMSGGQRQRIGLMRALMLDPSVLFLDEPLGALDPVTRYDLQQELKDLFNQLDKTVVMVTHDLAEAAYFGHTITLLHGGKIEVHGDFQTLKAAPNHTYAHRFMQAHRPLEAM
jgi:osmoprotectant transport system ATP-binding protein